MTGTDHPNLTRMREGYDAFGKGDLAALTELWREDVHWHEPGGNQLSGDYEGPQAVFGMFGRIVDLTGGSFRVEPVLLCADDEHGTALVRITAHRGDLHAETLSAHVTRFDADGRLAEFWDAPTDQPLMDRLFG